MLRRRILASAMASVMAIGSAAVVANAEDAAAATTQVKTKADLEAYVRSFDTFRVSGINDYGSISGDRFAAMCDFCDNVLADTASTIDDYTSAYYLLKATYDNLKIYTAEELKALVDANRKTYETDNLLNEEYGDAIYKDDNGQWGNFANAFENAEAVLNSSDSRIISDAYEELADTRSKLSALTVVTKAQFRTAMKNLETALQLEYKYDYWRRGKIVDTTWAVQWAFDDYTYAWGTIFNAVNAQVGAVTTAYDTLNERKSVNKSTDPAITDQYSAAVNYATVLNSFVADETARGSKASVKNLLSQYHNLLVADYATTAAMDLYNALVDVTYPADVATEIGITTTSMNKATTASGLHPTSISVDKNIAASLTVKPTYKKPNNENASKVYLVTKDGYANIYDEDGHYDSTKIADAISTSNQAPEGCKNVAINKNVAFDVLKYIKVDAADVDAATADNHEINDIFDGDTYAVTSDHWSGKSVVGSWILQGTSDGNFTNTDDKAVKSFTTLDKAMTLAEFYLNAKKDDWANSEISDIDDTDSIAEGSEKGSSVEWTLVYRYLKYALEDKYKGSTSTHTKAEVAKLIEDAYELAEKTGDAAMFAYNHNNLVDTRQDALDWLKIANKDKKYKDNTIGYTFGAGEGTATDVYNALNNEYTQLKMDYEAFSVSFGEIFYRLAEIADMIDNGDIVATEAILAGIDDVAFKLVTVQSLDDEIGVAIENDVFTSEYTFNAVNRVFTKNGEHFKEFDYDADNLKLTVPKPDADHPAAKSHKDLYDAYVALNDLVKAQTDPKYAVGDVNKDGKVNALDAAEILKAVVAGTADKLENADHNADKVNNALDAASILKAVVNG